LENRRKNFAADAGRRFPDGSGNVPQVPEVCQDTTQGIVGLQSHVVNPGKIKPS